MAKKPAAKTPAKTAAKAPEPKETFRQKLSDVFEDMWETIGKHHMSISGRAIGGEEPVADLTKSAKALTYSLEVPGMTEGDIHVSVSGGLLTVSGEKSTEREEKGEGFVFRERSYGSFARTFALPAEALEDGVTAHLENGVLTVKVPLSGKAAAQQAKRIPIQKK
ncbi:MAG: hypothetical protein COW30_07405 [Rhodospirillales bacterium CG15_BIG_FIL_POST_REV_8_21_14_020_66_15]|nr:MAG: hypothetical protein COW30_07405 [Rhodospirillales bacterium CG15_BIG_FIL_POST_REV_8_21_14_020_66_15]